MTCSIQSLRYGTPLLIVGLLCLFTEAAGTLQAQPPAEIESNEDAAALHAAPGTSAPEAPADPGHLGHDVHVATPHEAANPAAFRTDLAIYTFLVFLLLFAVLWRFAWGPIVAGLAKREQGIADNIAEARRCRDEAKLMLQQYETKLAEAQNEVREILDEARRDAEHTQQEILAAARVEADRERNRSLAEIDTATAQALKQLAEKSTNLAVELAGKIVQAQLNRDDHNRLISDAVTKFVDADPSQN